MTRRVPQTPQQVSFEWFEDPNADDADGGGDAGDYELRGADRFRRLPLELPAGFTFYLGAHHASDLARSPVPLFLSRRALVLDPAQGGTTAADWPTMDRQRRTLPRARSRWAIDSAGFTELNQFGCHHIPAAQYAAEVCRYAEEIGNLDFAAVQDWMCEAQVLRVTGQDIDRHQQRTVESYMELVSIAPHLPWAPVLQGFFPGDHERHLAMYYKNGIDLRCAPTVGVGSVCRRQGMVEADEIVRQLSGMDLKLHLFGYKFTGLPQTLRFVKSADSMAWSQVARKQWVQMPGHDHSTPTTAQLWRRGDVHALLEHKARKGWLVRWDARDKRTQHPVASRDAGEAALGAAGFAFVRLMWTCQNCFEWAQLWRNNMLALAVRGARADSVARHYGHRPLTPEELADWRASDPTEDWGAPEVTRGDYERARSRMEDLSRVRVPRAPRCRPPSPDAAPCAPARYLPPGAPPVQWPRPPRVRVVALGPGPLEEFRPWAPGEGSTLLDARPAPLDDAAVDELARQAAAETYDRNDFADVGYMDVPSVAYAFAAQRFDERLPASPAFGRLLVRLRGVPRGQRRAFARRFRGAYERDLWALYEAEHGEASGEAPASTSPHWEELLGDLA